MRQTWARDRYQLPWSNLVVLHVYECSTWRFFENLDKMTPLEELVIRQSHGVPHDLVNTGSIE